MFHHFRGGFLARAAAGATVGLLIAAVVTYVTPRKYESEAVIEVRPVAGEESPFGNRPAEGDGAETPRYLKGAAARAAEVVPDSLS